MAATITTSSHSQCPTKVYTETALPTAILPLGPPPNMEAGFPSNTSLCIDLALNFNIASCYYEDSVCTSICLCDDRNDWLFELPKCYMKSYPHAAPSDGKNLWNIINQNCVNVGTTLSGNVEDFTSAFTVSSTTPPTASSTAKSGAQAQATAFSVRRLLLIGFMTLGWLAT